jgi:hypothetical protein
MPDPRRGTVIAVAPDFLVVKDDTGDLHNFINGSRNSVLMKYRELGVVGDLKYINYGSFACWYFQPD